MTEKRGFHQALWRVLGFLAICVAVATVTVNAQNIRLRSNLNPVAGTSQSKYADITADGNIAVMGSYNTRGGFIFDISNPDAPVLRAHYNPDGGTRQFLEAIVVGNRAYFGSGNGDGVHIVDITNPSQPVLLGKVNTANGGYNTVHEIFVDGNFLYENSNCTSCANERAIRVFNISNPAQPVFVRNITLNNTGWVHAVYVRNGKMYTSGFGGNGLTEIWDVSNVGTQAPTLLGQVTSGPSTHSSWVSEDGNYLYVCIETFNGALRVYDIRNIAQPLLVRDIRAADLDINAVCPHNPVVKDNKLYVGWYQAGVQVFDLTNPADPKRIGQYDTFTPQYSEAQARAELANLQLEPEDIICGADSLTGALPSGFNGTWTAFPVLGHDKVLLADLATGLWIVDASRVSAPRNKVSDFDGDGKTDYSVYRRTAASQWGIENSSNGSSTSSNFGIPTDIIRPGDYDGDGKTDVAVFRDGFWYSLNSSNSVFRSQQFGAAGDVPVSADYDGDGRTDVAVWRPSNGNWYAQQSTLGFYARLWGANGDEPVVGDFDGDGKNDVTVVRNVGTNKVWYTLQSSSSIPQGIYFGASTDKTVVADFDGDGRTDQAVFRADSGTWYIRNARLGTFSGVQFGSATDVPIPADYDGDSKADIAVYRPDNKNWYGLRSADGTFFARQFGAGNDIPTPCAAQSQQTCVIP